MRAVCVGVFGPEKDFDLYNLLEGIPDVLQFWQFAPFSRNSIHILNWIANNIAWTFYENGEFQKALPYAEAAARGANWDEDAYRDTLVCILLGLGQKEKACPIVYASLGRNSQEFVDYAMKEEYQKWILEME